MGGSDKGIPKRKRDDDELQVVKVKKAKKNTTVAKVQSTGYLLFLKDNKERISKGHRNGGNTVVQNMANEWKCLDRVKKEQYELRAKEY